MSGNIGLSMLDANELRAGLINHFSNCNSDYEKTGNISCDSTNQYDYYLNSKTNTLVLLTPVPTNSRERGDDFNKILNKIATQESIISENYHIITPVIGEGMTEKHITTAYSAPGQNKKLILFDSKISDPTILLTSPNGPIGNRFSIRKIPKGIWRSRCLSIYKQRIENASKTTYPYFRNLAYIGLGTQSFLDGWTCGFHTLSHCIMIKELIDEAAVINENSLIQKIKAENPIVKAQKILKNADIDTSIHLKPFIIKAWSDTFLPGLSAQKRKQLSFKNYFFGYPHNDHKLNVTTYVICFGFIFTPAKNLLKLCFLLPILILAESLNWARHRLCRLAPTTRSGKITRTVILGVVDLLYFAFKSISLLAHAIFSPMSSYQAAKKIHWSLGVISAICSVVGIGLLLVLAAPAIAPALTPTIITQVAHTSWLANIATPITWMLSKLGFSIGANFTSSAAITTIGATLATPNAIREANTNQMITKKPNKKLVRPSPRIEKDWVDDEFSLSVSIPKM